MDQQLIFPELGARTFFPGIYPAIAERKKVVVVVWGVPRATTQKKLSNAKDIMRNY